MYLHEILFVLTNERLEIFRNNLERHFDDLYNLHRKWLIISRFFSFGILNKHDKHYHSSCLDYLES